MTLLDPAFLLLRKLSENFAEVTSQFYIQCLFPIFGDKHNVVLAIPRAVVEAFILGQVVLPSVMLGRLTGGSPTIDFRKCQTVTVSPAEPGGFPLSLKAHY